MTAFNTIRLTVVALAVAGAGAIAAMAAAQGSDPAAAAGSSAPHAPALESSGDVQVGTVNNELLAEIGFRLEVPPAGSANQSVPEPQAQAAAAAAFPDGTFVDAELASWRNLRGAGPVADGALVWVVQSTPEGFYVGGGIFNDGAAANDGERFHIDVIDAATGEWLFAHERMK